MLAVQSAIAAGAAMKAACMSAMGMGAHGAAQMVPTV